MIREKWYVINVEEGCSSNLGTKEKALRKAEMWVNDGYDEDNIFIVEGNVYKVAQKISLALVPVSE